MEEQYSVPNDGSITEQLEQISSVKVTEYFLAHQQDILGIVDGSYLEGYHDYDKGVAWTAGYKGRLHILGIDMTAAFLHILMRWLTCLLVEACQVRRNRSPPPYILLAASNAYGAP